MIMSRKMNIDECYTSENEEIKVHSSFSSTLLEAIYRSINREEEPVLETIFAEESRKKKQTSARDLSSKRMEIEKWMEKRSVSSGLHENPLQKPLEVKVVDIKMLLTGTGRRNHGTLSSNHNSNSSISVERDAPKAISKFPKSKSTNSGYQIPNTTNSNKMKYHNEGASKSSHFVKTKSHALKFYKELKKMKQPISPGGRITTLINSLFLPGHSKKAKYTNEDDQDHKEAQQTNGNYNKSTCSSASSLSRSCLSQKTSSSSTSSMNKATRSVRFSSPNMTIIYDQKPVRVDERCTDVVANDIHSLLTKYHNEDLFAIYNEFEEEDGDRVSSCTSSDLFELDNLLSPVGMEELPVYETTTRLDANRPIANSFLA